MRGEYTKLKIAMIGAGSVSFCPATLGDIVLSDEINAFPVTVALMDIDDNALRLSEKLARKLVAKSGRHIDIIATTDLDAALIDADFVITAIEKDRMHFWSQDFHIPRRYGFKQVFGENGGPGGLFHFLRNVGPTVHIAKTMERLCPGALLINYSNPEAKLVEAIGKLTNIQAVGVCHGYAMGVEQVSRILKKPEAELDVLAYGLNHFGFITKITDKSTGADLYPEFKAKERLGHWLSDWDELALSRIMLRTFGLWPYPGANHIGEYLSWAEDYLASTKIQYFFDPVADKPWETKQPPTFVYSFSSQPTHIPFDHVDPDHAAAYESTFENRTLQFSGEYGIPIIEAVVYDKELYIPSLNVQNMGQMPGILDGMCVEGPCVVDRLGVKPVKVDALPTAIEAMLNKQGYVQRLVIEAYRDLSRNKLLEALLVDPTATSYENAVAVIDEIFKLQEGTIAPLKWQ